MIEEKLGVLFVNGYFDLNFDEVHAATNHRREDGIAIRLVDLISFAFV